MHIHALVLQPGVVDVASIVPSVAAPEGNPLLPLRLLCSLVPLLHLLLLLLHLLLFATGPPRINLINPPTRYINLPLISTDPQFQLHPPLTYLHPSLPPSPPPPSPLTYPPPLPEGVLHLDCRATKIVTFDLEVFVIKEMQPHNG